MATSRANHEPIEAFEQGCRPTLLVDEVFPFRTPDLSLDTTLVKAVKERIQIGLEIQFVEVEPISLVSRKIAASGGIRSERRSDLKVLPLLALECGFERGEKWLERVPTFQQGLAVIGKWKRDHPATGQPAFDTAEHDRVAQLRAGRRVREGQWLVSIGECQGVQPG